MITAEHEKAQSGSGDFHDVVALEFSDGDQEIHGLVRASRAPGAGTTSIVGVLFDHSEVVCQVSEEMSDLVEGWESVESDHAALSIETPLERWHASLDCSEGGFSITASALGEPLELAAAGSELSSAAGVTEYGQLCEIVGEANVGGRKRKLRGSGWRMHVWGAPDWSSLGLRRSIHFGSTDAGGLAVLTARPANAESHAADVLAGRLVLPDGTAAEAEQLLLSAVYDDRRRPNRASLEFYLPGEEYARRLSGQAVCTAEIGSGSRRHLTSFFRWSLDGRPGWGSVQTLEPS